MDGTCRYKAGHFCAVYDYAGKADLSKGRWSGIQKKIGASHTLFREK